ncbi:MAG TPA: hypothetical protein VF490_17850, partial [Chryseosolibacter sp.]
MTPLIQTKSNKRRPRRSLNTILVLAFLCFTGHFSAFSSCAYEEVRTELNVGATVDRKNTGTFISFSLPDCVSSNAPWPAPDFIWRNAQYQSRINARFRVYAKKPFKTYATHNLNRYSNDSPDEPDPRTQPG